MLDDPDDLAILEGVLGLATAFRRQVIAEGVETVAHGEMLLQLGCELAQGYGIARPMPAHELPGWSAAWRPDPAWSDLAIDRDDLPLLLPASSTAPGSPPSKPSQRRERSAAANGSHPVPLRHVAGCRGYGPPWCASGISCHRTAAPAGAWLARSCANFRPGAGTRSLGRGWLNSLTCATICLVSCKRKY